MTRLPGYAVVTPVRNEAENLRRTADGLVRQRHRPLRWVIVDDGSSDGTGALADGLAATHDWIEALHLPPGRPRARGGPIVQAFNAGLARTPVQAEFVSKIDGDIFVPPHYFEWVADVFRREPRAGIVGGVVQIPIGERWERDPVTLHNVHGAVKAYRRACLEAIGGLHATMGWDGIDEHAAHARGWTSRVLTELHVLHYAPRGSKQKWARARWEEGRGAHAMGYRHSFLLLRVANRMLVDPPPVVGGLVLGLGYVWASLTRQPRIPDPAAIAALRVDQAERMRGLLRLRRVAPATHALRAGPAFTVAGRDVDLEPDAERTVR